MIKLIHEICVDDYGDVVTWQGRPDELLGPRLYGVDRGRLALSDAENRIVDARLRKARLRMKGLIEQANAET
jgi:hypothetical protein